MRFRRAGAADATAIARLHADSWRRHYRGAYADSFLDGDVEADREQVWTERLRSAPGESLTVLAEDDAGLVGFGHAVFGSDPTWGALLDNLHVRQRRKRQGIGSELLGRIAEAVTERGTPLYLWVLEQNLPAQAFYAARGAECVGRAYVSPPGGVGARLVGAPRKLRFAWSEPAVLLGHRRPAARSSTSSAARSVPS